MSEYLKNSEYESRLTMLCKAHRQQGGTIHQFNHMYNIDFLSMSTHDFIIKLASIKLEQDTHYAMLRIQR